MPIFNFKCLSCGNEVQIFGKASELDDIKEGITCACDNPLFTQIVGAPGIVTYGSGFYKQGFTGD